MVKANILKVYRCARERSGAGERLITGEWFGLIGCGPLQRGQLLWGQNDDHYRDSDTPEPSPFKILSQTNTFCNTVYRTNAPHFVSLTFITSLVLLLHASFLSFLSVLPLTPPAVELLMGCWAGEISPAADLFVGYVCFALFLLLKICVGLGSVCVWLIKSAGASPPHFYFNQWAIILVMGLVDVEDICIRKIHVTNMYIGYKIITAVLCSEKCQHNLW